MISEKAFRPIQFYNNVKFINSHATELFVEIAQRLDIPLECFNLVKMDNKTPETMRDYAHGLASIKAIDERTGKEYNIRVSAMVSGMEIFSEDENGEINISQFCKFHRDRIIGKDYLNCDFFIYYKKDSNNNQIVYMINVSNNLWNTMLERVEKNPLLDFALMRFDMKNKKYSRHNLTNTSQEKMEKVPADKLEKFMKGNIDPRTYGSSGVRGRNTKMKITVVLSGETHDLSFANIKALFTKYGSFFGYKNYNSFKSGIVQRMRKGGFLKVSDKEYQNKRLFQAFVKNGKMTLNFDKKPIEENPATIIPQGKIPQSNMIKDKIPQNKVSSDSLSDVDSSFIVNTKYITMNEPKEEEYTKVKIPQSNMIKDKKPKGKIPQSKIP
jgi:hypothetical protein